MKKKKWIQTISEDEKKEIVEMARKGINYKIIAEHIGCCYASVSNYARRAGIQKFVRSESQTIHGIIEDRDKLPVTEIARKYGTKVSNVCGIIMRHYLRNLR